MFTNSGMLRLQGRKLTRMQLVKGLLRLKILKLNKFMRLRRVA
jgi:hypothetical protein